VDPYEGWTTEGHTWWEVGTPHVTEDDNVRAAHLDWEATREKQRRGV
jgi:3D-(3,5/4)-trihydroxycyclohexane-1,2-dione acylhydrolase (decyclizing)